MALKWNSAKTSIPPGVCHARLMTVPKPPPLPISPMTLTCPRCKARPGQVCHTAIRKVLETVHLERIEAAAMDAAERKI
jgi:hypothetical protein